MAAEAEEWLWLVALAGLGLAVAFTRLGLDHLLAACSALAVVYLGLALARLLLLPSPKRAEPLDEKVPWYGWVTVAFMIGDGLNSPPGDATEAEQFAGAALLIAVPLFLLARQLQRWRLGPAPPKPDDAVADDGPEATQHGMHTR